MMRVIRTEMYFEPSKATTAGRLALKKRLLWPVMAYFSIDMHSLNPGVGIAWFNLGKDATAAVEGLTAQRAVKIIHELGPDDKEAAVQLFLQTVIAGGTIRDWQLSRQWNSANRDLAAYVMRQEVVLEESPPFAVPLELLVKQSAKIAIGTIIGVGAAGGNYPLMFITVPVGIIVIGSAIGISKGLENGLNRSIERIVRRRLR
ncbi:MAG: hypothetical protein ACRED5_15275 [Propylenella sp.]